MKGRIVLVTGATGGIGEVTARELARMGATVIGVGRNPDKCAQMSTSLRQTTGNPGVEFLVADLSVQVLERNGDLYACVHYVYPQYRLGNVLSDDLGAMVDRSVASGFGPHKEATLPRYCRECEVLGAWWGGCPKHRFTRSPYGEPGLHYMCAGYKLYFTHIPKYLNALTKLLEYGIPASQIMQAVSTRILVVDKGDGGS